MENDKNINLILMAALRYALGRSSYIVSIVQDFIIRYSDNEYIKADITKYIKDIERHLEWQPEENPYIRETWLNLIKQLKAKSEQ